MKMFSRWREGRRLRRKQQRQVEILDKLVEAGLYAFHEGCRLAVPTELFDDEESVKRFISDLTEAHGGLVRASNNFGLLTFYDDDGVSDGKQVVVVKMETDETAAQMARK